MESYAYLPGSKNTEHSGTYFWENKHKIALLFINFLDLQRSEAESFQQQLGQWHNDGSSILFQIAWPQ